MLLSVVRVVVFFCSLLISQVVVAKNFVRVHTFMVQVNIAFIKIISLRRKITQKSYYSVTTYLCRAQSQIEGG